MNRSLAKRAGAGIVREGVSGSALIRGVVGTASAVAIVWGLGLPWLVLVAAVLLYVIYVLLRRVFMLEQELVQVRASVDEQHVDPSERRRQVRDGLAGFVAETQELMEQARQAFDSKPEEWEAWEAETSAVNERANAFVREQLGEPEFAELTEPPLIQGHYGHDAAYSQAVDLMSIRKQRLLAFIGRISPPV